MANLERIQLSALIIGCLLIVLSPVIEGDWLTRGLYAGAFFLFGLVAGLLSAQRLSNARK